MVDDQDEQEQELDFEFGIWEGEVEGEILDLIDLS